MTLMLTVDGRPRLRPPAGETTPRRAVNSLIISVKSV